MDVFQHNRALCEQNNRYVTVQYSTVRYRVVLYLTAQCSTVQCAIVVYLTSQYTTSYSTYPTECDAVKVVDVESLKNIVFFVNCEKNPILVGLQP